MSPNMEDSVCISCYTELEKAVGKLVNCKWAGRDYPEYRKNEALKDTVERVMPDADWVIYYGFDVMFNKVNVKVHPRRRFKLAIYIGDMHRMPDQQINYINGHGWDALMMLYTQLGAYVNYGARKIDKIDPEYYLKKVRIPIFNMAPCVNQEIFKPADKPKDVDVTMLGALGLPWYPLRFKIFRQMPLIERQRRWKTVVNISPPGRSLERKISKLYGKHYVGDKYVDIINRSKLFVFGTSVFKYPLLKFPEAMACRTCVAADTPLGAAELHLIRNWNYVEINENNWADKIDYYLKHPNEREEIAQRGYETFLKYHTTDIRAKQLVEFLEEHR